MNQPTTAEEAPVGSLVMFGLAILFLAALYATNTDSDGLDRCRHYLRTSSTAAESTASLSERPTRVAWRDLAPTCRELLSEDAHAAP